MEPLFKCVLIDDELLALSYLRTLCEGLPGIEVVKAYDDPAKAVEELPGLQIDFIISDIVMPEISGIELAQLVRKIPVVFTTAHNEYAADAFEVEATDYLRKPIQRERLEKAIEKVKREILLRRSQQSVIHLQTAKGKMQLAPHLLATITAETLDRRDKLLTLTNGEKVVIKNSSFEQLLELLPESDFCRISRSEIIALRIVTGYSGDRIFARSATGQESTHLLGEPYRKKFLEKWQHRFGT